MSRRHRLAGTVLTLPLAAASLTACTSFSDGLQDCPAIGYSAVVTVEVIDAPPELASVGLCAADGSGCAAPEETTRVDADTWAFDFLSQPAPDDAVVSAYDADGGLLYQQSWSTLAWERVGGTERCGGPSAASVFFAATSIPADLGPAQTVGED